MVVVVFRSRLRGEPGPEYRATADRMLALARRTPGFVSFRHYEAPDGERCSVVEFASDEAVRAWRAHPEHVEAQRRGREHWYAWYRLQTCVQLREAEHGGDGEESRGSGAEPVGDRGGEGGERAD